MKAKAYILMEVKTNDLPKLLDEVRAVEGVSSCDIVTGRYHMIAVIEADSNHELGRISYSRLRALEGITHTVTCTVMS